jgi:DNA topoisomerase-1
MAEKSSTVNGTNPFLTALAQDAAKDAGLRYFTDDRPGIRRRARGKSFVYLNDSGEAVRDVETLARIKRLAIPPAWTDVWICPASNGHIQATGRDARNRKQYRYHSRWREQRDQNKFERMMTFAEALPAIRQRVKRDLARPGLPREKVLASVVRLLETTLIRVGNDEYARHNKSYGLTTMHNRHVKVRGHRIFFSFKGKSGKEHEIDIHDPELADVVKRSQDLPGEELFAYEDDDGVVRDVTSQDVNTYLREISGDDFTAKDFRTWSGTVLAATALREFEAATNQRQARKNVVTAIEAVAKMLGNTPAVCRKCYVHPEILNSYLQGTTIEVLRQRMGQKLGTSLRKLKPEEAAVLMLLREKLGSQVKAAKADGALSLARSEKSARRSTPRRPLRSAASAARTTSKRGMRKRSLRGARSATAARS